MTLMDAIIKMSKGNSDAINVISIDFRHNREPLGMLDELNIHGSSLWVLYKDCCGHDRKIFCRTAELLYSGAIPMEQISKNLHSHKAIPFIDNSVIVEGVMDYEADDFGPFHPKWVEWCEAQGTSFEQRLSKLH